MASVRVDPIHHMVSFASKIEPSPDWIVGVTGLELCLRHIAIVDPCEFRLLIDTSSILHANPAFGRAVAPTGPWMGETFTRHIGIVVGWECDIVC